MSGRRTLFAVLGLLVVFGAGYAVVSPANFSGWDEWLVLDLTSRGIVSLPYQNRPLSYVFHLPGSLLTPGGLGGLWIVHGLYLWCAAGAVFLLVRRLAPGHDRLGFSAAALAATWAPLDAMRLDTVLLSGYSGATAAATAASLLLVEAWLRRSRTLLALASSLGFLTLRVFEGSAGLVVAAPLLLWSVPPGADGARRDPRGRYVATWAVLTAVGLALAARPLLPGAAASYQVSGLGFDPHPLRVLARLARQLAFQLGPLLHPEAGEWRAPAVALAAAVALAVGLWLIRGDRLAGVALPGEGAAALRVAAVGLAATLLGHSVLVLSASMLGPQRMQILSAPGIGMLLAGVLELGVAPLRAPWRQRVALALAVSIVAFGTGRTVALQREWNARSAWPAQRASLAGVTRVAPGLAPSTLVLLIDEAGAWPASFTFRHAMRLLYGSGVVGVVWGAEPFLYAVGLGPHGVSVTPYVSVQDAWQVRPTLHPFESVVVLRGRPDRVEIVEEWPQAVLGALPAGAVYAPRQRITAAPANAHRAILDAVVVAPRR
jgi:hypothetical protein